MLPSRRDVRTTKLSSCYENEQICITEKLSEKREKDLIASLIRTINVALAPIDLRLLQVDDEYDDDNDYLVLINDHQESDLLREASGFTTTDFALFHLWDEAKATIRLDTRGIAELQTYFNAHAEELDLKKCSVCGKFIVLKSRAVSCNVCGNTLHRQCILKTARNSQSKKTVCVGEVKNGRICGAELHIPPSVDLSREESTGTGCIFA
ncbi:unnamed protein product [Gongylonema pulchrum]|uniref:Phorbol-ester/DAG-type domain-containing protein n=1 Tax=Gongylonema pulchrum TaxID=637853 RepID=A0A183DPU5_9BILA|nr:unnamed protein product [Gongylonema pulchrum]